MRNEKWGVPSEHRPVNTSKATATHAYLIWQPPASEPYANRNKAGGLAQVVVGATGSKPHTHTPTRGALCAPTWGMK